MMTKEVSSEDKKCGQSRDSAKGKDICDRVIVRRLDSKDSVRELTDLLHCSFKLGEKQPYVYPFAEQSEEITLLQINRGDCLVAKIDGRLIGFGLVIPPKPDADRRWYSSRLSAYLKILAVHPDFEGMGIGTELLDHCEKIAINRGAWELKLSSPLGSRNISYYKKRGYKVLRYFKFSDINYYSLLMAKYLLNDKRDSIIRIFVRKIKLHYSYLLYKLGYRRKKYSSDTCQ